MTTRASANTLSQAADHGVATVFGAVALLVLSGPFGVLFSGGLHIAITLAHPAVGSPFLSANFMMNRVFYAAENAKTPFVIQCILIVFGVGTALLAGVLPPGLIIFGLAVSYTLGSIRPSRHALFLGVFRLGNYGAAAIAVAHLRFIAAAAVSGVVGSGLLWLFGGFSAGGFSWQSRYAAALVLAVVGLSMAVVYFAAL